MKANTKEIQILSKIYRTTPENVDDSVSIEEHIQHVDSMIEFDERYSSNQSNPPDQRTMVAERLANRRQWLEDLKFARS